MKELKKKAARLIREIADRLERRMPHGRTRSLEHFTEVYVMHGLGRRVAERLGWGLYGTTLEQTFAFSGHRVIDEAGQAAGASSEPLSQQKKAPETVKDLRRFQPWAQQVSNLRPLPCEIVKGASTPVFTEYTGSQTSVNNQDRFTSKTYLSPTPTPIFTSFTTRRLPDFLLTLSEVAERLRVCTATASRLCSQGKLPSIRVVNSVRVAAADLEIFIRKRGKPR